MKFKLLTLIPLGMLVLFSSLTYSQEAQRWSNSSAVYATGNYVELPQKLLPVDRSMEPRVIKTPYEVLTIFPNIMVLPSVGCYQAELYLACCRTNPNFMFGSSNAVTTGFVINSGSYITTNGGSTWFGSNIINNGNPNNQRGDPGPIIDKNQRVIFTHLSANSSFGAVTGMAAEYSTNFGQNFSASVQVHSVADQSDDKNLAGTDDNPGSPFYGNSYMAWCNYQTGTSFCARTTDGGVTWQTPVSWAPPGGTIAQGHDVDCTPLGTVIVAYTFHTSLAETGVGIGRSTNGGVSFTQVAPAYSCSGSRSNAFNGWGIRTNGFPRVSVDKSGGTRNGWIYVVTSELNLAPAGSDADIILHRSTNDGLTWSAGIRVNQDALNNGKVQWFPCVNVDANGGVNVAYYDNRNFPSVGDSATVFISRSLDGGNSWIDAEVADHHFRPKAATGMSGGYMGDYIGVTSGNGKIWAFWMDDKPISSGFYQAWAGYILAGAPPQHDITTGPFMNMPVGNNFLVNTPYNIQTRIQNIGTANETSVPFKWFINGTLTNTTNKNLNSMQVDSVGNTWTPTVAGTYNLMYASALVNDTNRFNDTAKVTVNVLTSIPSMCPFSCQPLVTYTAISGTNGPSGDDATLTVPIGFTYTYKGNAFTQASICTNGWVVLGTTTNNAYTNDISTVDATLVNMIAGFWDDLNAAAGSIQYTTQGSAPNRVFIVQYTNVAFFSGGGAVTFQVRLYEQPTSAGALEVIYGPGTTNAAATGSVGINVQPGGSGNFTSITPGSSGCTNTTSSTTTANNSVTYSNLPTGTHYVYCPLVGITQNGNIVPKVYSLSQNYPNPFNPTTKVQFALPKAGDVKLVVYDLLGAEVATLVNGHMEAGNHDITFNGESLASGVYFYKIEAGSFSDVKKMVLMK